MSVRGEPHNFWTFLSRTWPWFALLAILLFTSTIRVRLLDVPLERDEGEYAYTAQLLLDGRAPFDGAYSLKLPGTAYMYAASFLVFGESVEGIQLGLILVNILTTILLAGIGLKLGGRLVGFAAGASYAVASLSVSVAGFSANTEHYAALFFVLGVALLLRYRERMAWYWATLAGLGFGMAMLMKQHVAFLALWAGLVLLWYARKQTAIGKVIAHIALFAGSVFIPLTALVIHVWSRGTLSTMRFWVWDYAKAYASINPVREAVTRAIVGSGEIFITLGGIVILALLGLYYWRRVQKLSTWWLICTWVVASLAAVSVGFYFRPHYFILALPAMCICAGLGVRATFVFLRKLHGERFALVGAMTLVALALAWVPVREAKFWFTYASDDFIENIFPADHFAQLRVLAREFQQLTHPGDRVAVIGSEPELLFYSNRRSVTGYLYAYPFLEQQPYREQMFQEFVREVEAGRPEFIITVATYTGWGGKPWDTNDPIWRWVGSYVLSYESVLQREYSMHWQPSWKFTDVPRVERIVVYRRRS